MYVLRDRPGGWDRSSVRSVLWHRTALAVQSAEGEPLRPTLLAYLVGAAGIADHVWTMEEIVGLLEEVENQSQEGTK